MTGPRRDCGLAAAALLALTALCCDSISDGDRHAAPAETDAAAPSDVRQREIAAALAELRALETQQRRETNFLTQPPEQRLAGANPWRVEALPNGRWLVLLRGSARLQLRGNDGTLLSEVNTPAAPRALTLEARHSAQPNVWVGGGLDAQLRRYRIEGDTLTETERSALTNVTALSDIAFHHETGYGLDHAQQRVFSWHGSQPAQPLFECRGPRRIRAEAGWLVASCLYDHRLLLWRLSETGPTTRRPIIIDHDGPIWSWASRPLANDESALEVVLGGIEDHPLDRSQGFFGHIDSFIFRYRVSAAGAQRVNARNSSALGVVTPKALAWLPTGELLVTGYGAEHAVLLKDDQPPKRIRIPPGTNDVAISDAGEMWLANPLLDTVARMTISKNGDETLEEAISYAATAQPTEPERLTWLGEVLAFSYFMAPNNSSKDAHSRFSCEACHFEGDIDGRVHHTGRGDVHATTKPLRGLFNNKPHFTRALDPDLTRVSHAEFRVAGSGSGHDPWFSLPVADKPWLASRLGQQHPLTPKRLRKALLHYLMSASHPSNAKALARANAQTPAGSSRMTASQQHGMKLFAQHCTSCHAARTRADEPRSAIPQSQWEPLILSDSGPLVWASADYHKTNVVPYVHDDGARPTSLRRVSNKFPYFTNGSAQSLQGVVAAAGWKQGAFSHAAQQPERQLSAIEQADLVAFLQLL